MFQLVKNFYSITQGKKCSWNIKIWTQTSTFSLKSKILNYSWTEVKVDTNNGSTSKMNAAQHKTLVFCTMWKVFELRIYSNINPRMTKIKSISTPSLWSEQGYHLLTEAEKVKKKRCGQNHCSQLNIHPSPRASGQQQVRFFKYQILML